MNNSVEISVIICTYNTKEVTLRCLKQLKTSIDYLNRKVEVIVIENGTDGTDAVIYKKYPWIKLIKPKENVGYTKGNNLGIKKANKNSKYYLFLNSDALVKKDTLLKSVNYMEQNNRCSVLGCKLKFEDNTLQYSAGYLPTPFSVFNWIMGLDLIPSVSRILPQFHPKYDSYFNKDKKVGWVMGAFFFTRREVIKKTKGFDENFFMYTEEVEWCKRIEDADFEVWYTPSFEVVHLDKSSSIKDVSKIQKIFILEVLGVVYYLRKYYPNSINLMIPIIKMGLYLRSFAFYLLGNKMRHTAYIETIKKI